MANTFISEQNVGVTLETVVYTGKALTQATIIGLSVANTSAAAITASVKLNAAYLVKNAPVPVGGALIAIGGDQKVVVEAADTVSVIASGTVDVITSALEIS